MFKGMWSKMMYWTRTEYWIGPRPGTMLPTGLLNMNRWIMEPRSIYAVKGETLEANPMTPADWLSTDCSAAHQSDDKTNPLQTFCLLGPNLSLAHWKEITGDRVLDGPT